MVEASAPASTGAAGKPLQTKKADRQPFCTSQVVHAGAAGLAMHYVRQALRRWESRVEVVRVDAQRSEDDEARLDLSVEYRVRATQRGDRVTVYLDLERGNH